ncbi:hypothetical protein ACFL52_02825 [Candidatus Margulisiibacteriota bacterium]
MINPIDDSQAAASHLHRMLPFLFSNKSIDELAGCLRKKDADKKSVILAIENRICENSQQLAPASLNKIINGLIYIMLYDDNEKPEVKEQAINCLTNIYSSVKDEKIATALRKMNNH